LGLRAIISDIHANVDALEAVLKDIASKNITEIYCLGDVIGYGPNPRECILHARQFADCIRGNHEDALLFIAADFNMEAARSIEWTRKQLNRKECPKEENHQLWNFLGDLGDRVVEDRVLYIHGSPRVPTREYVRPADCHDHEKMDEIFSMIDHLCFVGHTHEPGVFTPDHKFFFPKQLANTWKVTEQKALINVGSVGQPRDRDPRACYVTYDGETVRYHRVPYDVESTMKKILAAKELPEYHALRLKDGR
jgi:diadenosine tetraphosphatase ApaH/serine/threonine PP2A family protein phosphatase